LKSAYSTYEHSLLNPTSALGASQAQTAAFTTSSLPLDIVVEALFSTVLLVLGIVIGSPALRPINWAAWAGQAENDMRRPKGKKRFENDGGAEGVSMAYLEDRRGFVDIRVSPRSHWWLSTILMILPLDTKEGICRMGSKWCK
jgi:Membrane magnesium transporter